MKKFIPIILGSALLISGCSNMDTTQQRTLSGGAIGATAGAVGAAIFHSNPIWGVRWVAQQLVQPLAMCMTCMRKTSKPNTTKAIKLVKQALPTPVAPHRAQSNSVLISIVPVSAL